MQSRRAWEGGSSHYEPIYLCGSQTKDGKGNLGFVDASVTRRKQAHKPGQGRHDKKQAKTDGHIWHQGLLRQYQKREDTE